MNRIVSILLVLILLLAETGATFALHFCGEKLASVQLNVGQENRGCEMNLNECDNSSPPFSKSNCCSNSLIRVEQSNSHIIFMINWLIIRIPVSRYQWEQVYSYDSLEDLQCEFIESPPTLRQNLIRSYLQVYVI
ncbi:MAG: hypothetical protein KJP21_05465 [Bacteroidia bacterium]|nr:hypothetical protein [Bacteroidia bacterium]